MRFVAFGSAMLVALAVITIGTLYVASPTAVTRRFGLPLPDSGTNTAWWFRLKGVRDIASGLTVLAFMAWGAPRGIGLILLVEAAIPTGDMLLVLAAKGSRKTAFGIYGLTAVVMVWIAIPMMVGVPELGVASVSCSMCHGASRWPPRDDVRLTKEVSLCIKRLTHSQYCWSCSSPVSNSRSAFSSIPSCRSSRMPRTPRRPRRWPD